jgi:uncharacterized membrane protein YphA (DoxX/SURF4 family)
MGPRNDVQTPPSESSHGVDSHEEVEPTPQIDGTLRSSGHNLRIADWFFRSSAASLIWLVVRVVLGYWWINAGYQKIWGSEKSAFWFGGGAGVKGFATAGVAGSATGKGGASYGWWAAFLHNFVIPNASWIAKFIALGELAIGIALVLGLFTGLLRCAGSRSISSTCSPAQRESTLRMRSSKCLSFWPGATPGISVSTGLP